MEDTLPSSRRGNAAALANWDECGLAQVCSALSVSAVCQVCHSMQYTHTHAHTRARARAQRQDWWMNASSLGSLSLCNEYLWMTPSYKPNVTRTYSPRKRDRSTETRRHWYVPHSECLPAPTGFRVIRPGLSGDLACLSTHCV